MENPNDLVGKFHVFEDDGSRLSIIQVKQKDVNGEVVPFVTYTIEYGNNLPRKLVMPYDNFIGQFGHLFET